MRSEGYIAEQKIAEEAVKDNSELLHAQNEVLKLIAQGKRLAATLDLLLLIIEVQSPGMLDTSPRCRWNPWAPWGAQPVLFSYCSP